MSRPDVARKRLVIAFDAECLVAANPSGVAYYTRGLIENLAAFYKDDVELIGHYCSFLGEKKGAGLPQAPNISYAVSKIISVRVLNMLRRLGVPVPFEFLTGRRADFHLYPAFIGWPSLFKTPSAPIIHDVAFLDHPEFVNGVVRHDLTKLVPKEVKRAAFVITNSNHSVKQLQKHFSLKPTNTVVTSIPPVHMLHVEPAKARQLLKKLGVSNKFLLFMGNLEPRKNIAALIEAYGLLDSKLQKEYSLVLAGGKGWLDDDITRTLEQARAKGLSVITPGYITEQERAALYTNATASVFVSKYEGFGMPLLESMQYKTPVIASDIPVLREVAGDAALYCETDSKDIAKALSKLLSDPKLQSRLISSGEKRLKAFSWRTVSELVYSKIREVVK